MWNKGGLKMADYISKEAVVRYLKGYSEKERNSNSPYGMITSSVLYKVERAFSEMPAADVQPIKHGRWIPQGDDMWLCSNCRENKIFSAHESDRTEKQRYCCRCGARMDGDAE